MCMFCISEKDSVEQESMDCLHYYALALHVCDRSGSPKSLVPNYVYLVSLPIDR